MGTDGSAGGLTVVNLPIVETERMNVTGRGLLSDRADNARRRDAQRGNERTRQREVCRRRDRRTLP